MKLYHWMITSLAIFLSETIFTDWRNIIFDGEGDRQTLYEKQPKLGNILVLLITCDWYHGKQYIRKITDFINLIIQT